MCFYYFGFHLLPHTPMRHNFVLSLFSKPYLQTEASTTGINPKHIFRENIQKDHLLLQDVHFCQEVYYLSASIYQNIFPYCGWIFLNCYFWFYHTLLKCIRIFVWCFNLFLQTMISSCLSSWAWSLKNINHCVKMWGQHGSKRPLVWFHFGHFSVWHVLFNVFIVILASVVQKWFGCKLHLCILMSNGRQTQPVPWLLSSLKSPSYKRWFLLEAAEK